jgi:hypothetical protein
MPEGSRVELPPHVTEPFEVFLNGIPQRRGIDYEQLGRTLVFPRELKTEGRLGFWRWASLWLGVAGTYRQNDVVDVAYRSGGKRQVATGLPFEPVDEAPSL